MTSSRPDAVLPLLAASPEVADIAWGVLLLSLLGGLALFLYGLRELSSALRAVAGDRMRALLARLTRNRWMGAVTGAFVTAVIQSSSVTTVLVVGFVSAGLMTLTQSVGVIMGANVGTTITAQIIALKVTQYALGLVALGFGMAFFVKRERVRLWGLTVLGLGLVFLGMNIMSESVAPLKSYQPFIDVMAHLEHPALAILAGAVFTALVQSSSATTGVVIVLASQGLIPLMAGIGIILGANVGTCVTAVLASLGQPREAQRAALVHVLFNVLGVLIWLPLLGYLAEFVGAGAEEANGITATPRRIANAHTIFNVANTLLFLPLAGIFARFVTRVLPDPPPDAPRGVRTRYLDDNLLATPSLALDRVRQEILRLASRVKAMFVDILPAMLTGTRSDLDAVAARDDEVDFLYGEIVAYLGRVSHAPLQEDQTTDLVHLMEIAGDLENIGDVIETNLVGLGRQRLERGVVVSAETRRVLEAFHAEVLHALDAAELAVTQGNVDAARVVRDMKGEINRMANAAALHGVDRLVADEPHRLAAYALERDMLENLKRVYYFAKRMARVITTRDADGR